MNQETYNFSGNKVDFYFNGIFTAIDAVVGDAELIVITDENVYELHADKFAGMQVIKFSAGEQYKSQATADRIIAELIKLGANRHCFILGVGGGVVTDMAGYVAAVYMRGTRFALVPTTILAMVDAAIGGKNGVDVGVYKNIVGTIRQPEFIFYDYSFLNTLPEAEWVNGFAEVIKHACIKDGALFAELEENSLEEYRADKALLAALVERNVEIKTSIVSRDEFEKGERKLLNFGHTIGHAVENLHGIPHGHAVSIGMVAACNLSEKINGFHFDEAVKIVELLSRYHLPVDLETDHSRVFEVLKMDKKRKDDGIQFILLKKTGEAEIKQLSLADLEKHFKDIV